MPLVKQATGPVATTVNNTGTISFNDMVYEYNMPEQLHPLHPLLSSKIGFYKSIHSFFILL